jgi:hypothetical protein
MTSNLGGLYILFCFKKKKKKSEVTKLSEKKNALFKKNLKTKTMISQHPEKGVGGKL